MYKVLIVSHSTLCKGFNDAVEMILGDSVEYLGLDDDGIDIFHERLKEKIINIKEQGKEVLILADLFGGSPFNKALYEANKDEKIRLLSGVNLSMVIEAIMNETSDLDEVIIQIVESSKDSIKQGVISKNTLLGDE